MKVVNVGLVGYGVVGKGTAEILIKNNSVITAKTGITINLAGIADRNIDSKLSPMIKDVPVKTKDAYELVNNPDIDIIIELVGGYTYSKDLITEAIKKGKHVVTANKALLAIHGKEIFALAAKHGVEIAFEAAVGGGIPIIKVLKEDLSANNITSIEAIINGTSNYILSRMKDEGKDYSVILKDAQELGYAEADPTFDVEGIDAAHKITLLASIAFGTWVNFDDVYIEGISKISAIDINFARELNCSIKLLAIAKYEDGKIDVRVHPTMLPDSYLLASVNNVNNAVQVTGDYVGKTLHYGRGAGGHPTGSSVVGDIISIARNIVSDSTGRVNPIGYVQEIKECYPVKHIDNVESAFYLRFSVTDKPGVLSYIAGVLANNRISIKSAIQESGENCVPLVFMTHKASGKQIFDAVKEINASDYVHNQTVIIRVEG